MHAHVCPVPALIRATLSLLVIPHVILPQLATIDPCSQSSTHQKCSAQLPIQRVRLGWRRSQTISEHDGYEGADRIGDGLIRKVVCSRMRKGRGYQGHGVEMRIDHFLDGDLSTAIRYRCVLTSFSSPVRYPRLSLSLFIDALSPFSAADKRRYHPSMNSFVYSLEAPKSINWIWSVEER